MNEDDVSMQIGDQPPQPVVVVGLVTSDDQTRINDLDAGALVASDKITALGEYANKRSKEVENEFVKQRKRVDRRLFILYAFLVVAFVLLAVRSEFNSAWINSNAHRLDVNSWNTCVNSANSRTSINATNQAFVDVLISVKPQTPAAVHLLAVYKNGILPIPDCGPKP